MSAAGNAYSATSAPADARRNIPPSVRGRRRSLLRRSHSDFTTYAHAVCRRCGHWIDGQRWTIVSDPELHTSLACDKCGTKIFGVGGRSARSSLVSLLTRSSGGRRRSSIVICTNVRDNLSESPTASNGPARRASAPLLTNVQEVADPDPRTHTFPQAHGKSSSDSSAQEFGTTEVSAATTLQTARDKWKRRLQWRRSTSQPRQKLRVKLLDACIKPLRKILGPDVSIQVTQKSLAAPPTASMNAAASLSSSLLSPNSPLTRRGSNSGATRPFKRHSRGVPDAHSEESHSQNPAATNPPASRDEGYHIFDEDAESPRGTSSRKDNYRPRRQANNEARIERRHRIICDCPEAQCPCMGRGQDDTHYALLSHPTLSTPSLIPSSRTSTEQTEATSRWSLYRDATLRHLGGAVTSPQRGGHDSVVSSTSGRTDSRRTSNSRPSHISVQFSERASNSSRRNSGSGRATNAIVISSMMPAAIGRMSNPVEHRGSLEVFRSAPGSPVFTNGLITEEPQEEEGDRPAQSPLRIATDGEALDAPTIIAEGSAEAESHGNSSVTVTQERHDEMEFMRGSRPG